MTQVAHRLRHALLLQVVRRGEQADAQHAQRPGHQRTVGQAPDADRQIEALLHEIDVARRQHHVEVDVGVLLHEARHDRRDQQPADVFGGRHAHLAARQVLQFTGAGGGALDLFQCMRRHLVQALAGIGQVQRARGAL